MDDVFKRVLQLEERSGSGGMDGGGSSSVVDSLGGVGGHHRAPALVIKSLLSRSSSVMTGDLRMVEDPLRSTELQQ